MLLKALLEEFYTLFGCKVVHQNFFKEALHNYEETEKTRNLSNQKCYYIKSSVLSEKVTKDNEY